jgi:transcriptional regulator with XRE-family HTH domain
MSNPVRRGISVNTTSAKRKQITQSLGDKEERDAFVAEHIAAGIAFQIRAMREARGWSQEELGCRSGKAQAEISRLENPDLSSYSLSTLKRLASAFDVALIVRFVPFSALVDYAASLSAEDLRVPAFDQDVELREIERSATIHGETPREAAC